MKTIYFALIILAYPICGLPLGENRFETKHDLPEINVKLFRQFNPNGLEVIWDPVENNNDTEPIVGYKLKEWELYRTVYTPDIVDGDAILVPKILPGELRSNTVLDDDEARIYTMPINQTSYTFNNIKFKVQYVFTLQTYSKIRDGPRSNPTGLMFSLPDNTTTETPI